MAKKTKKPNSIKPGKVQKSAKTGRFVSKKTATHHPATTFEQTIKPRRKPRAKKK